MKTSVSIYYWLPRILGILAILFISMFALDAFAEGLTIWQQIAGFLIHLIPSFVLLALLIVAWRREFVGGLIFMLIGIIFIPFIFSHNYSMHHSIRISIIDVLIVNFPFILVGALFLVSHRMKKQGNRKESIVNSDH